MQFSQEKNLTSYTIRSYSAGKINIAAPPTSRSDSHSVATHSDAAIDGPQEVVLTESFIMTPDQLIRNWPPRNVTELNAEHLVSVTDLDPEVILLGTGDTLTFPAQSLTFNIMAGGIGVEIMDTAAACRTYNVLMNEGRHVAVAVMI